MGVRGPAPKRLDEPMNQRVRERKLAAGAHQTYVTGEVVRPQPDPDWHPIARLLWNSAVNSPQARYYEETDWVVAYNLCEDLSYYKFQGKRSAQMLTAINTMLTSMLFTEGERRRLNIEFTRDEAAKPEKSAGITALEEWAKRRKDA